MSAKPGEVAPGDAGVPPEWASGAAITDPTSGQLSYIEPPVGVKATGFVPFRLKPPRNWDNWLLRQNYLWQQYFDATSQRAATVVVAAVDASADSRRMADFLCDGVADNVQILAAIAALPAAGGLVLLSEGTFTVNASLVIPANVKVRGQGYGATQVRVTAGSVLAYDVFSLGTGCGLHDLEIDGTPAAGGAVNNAVRLNTVNGCSLSGLRILGMVGGYGIYLTDCSELHVADCRIDNCDLAGLKGDETIIAQRRIDVRAVHLSSNGLGFSQVEWECSGSDLVCLGLDGGGGARNGIRVLGGENLRILGGEIFDHAATGLLIGAAAHVLVSSLVVDTATAGGIDSSATDTTIQGCDLHDIGGAGVVLAGTASAVRGCRIATCTGDGVALGAIGGIAADNNISGVDEGVVVLAGAHRCEVADNRIADCQNNGIRADLADDVAINDNVFGLNGLSNALGTADVKVTGCARPKIHGNKRTRTNGAAGINQVEWSIYVTAGVGPVNSTECMITDNMTRVAKNPGNNGIPGGGAVGGSSIQVDAAQTVLGYRGFLAGGTPVLDSNQQVL